MQFFPGGGRANMPRDFLIDGFADLVRSIAHTGKGAADVLVSLIESQRRGRRGLANAQYAWGHRRLTFTFSPS